MTLQELLAANGVNDEAQAKIIAGMKENKLFIVNEENLDIRYGKLKTDHEAATAKNTEHEKTIAQLQAQIAAAGGNAEANAQLQAQVAALQKELDNTRLDAVARQGLLEAGATDVDYMLYKLREKGEMQLDEKGKIKGWEDKISGLKTQCPTQFSGGGAKKVEPNKLPDADNNSSALTRAEILKKPYAERAKIFNESPEAYKEAMKK